MKYVLSACLLFIYHGNGYSQLASPNFASTVKFIQESVNRFSTDSAVFDATDNGEFHIGKLYSNFFHLKASEDKLDSKDFVTRLDSNIAVRREGAYYQVVLFKPQEVIFAIYRDKEYALQTHKALLHLFSLCKAPNGPFD